MTTRTLPIDKVERLLAALANRHRLTILRAISAREMTVTQLCVVTGLTQSALSQHLAKLRAVDIVVTRREAQHIYYSCESADVSILLQAIARLPGIASS